MFLRIKAGLLKEGHPLEYRWHFSHQLMLSLQRDENLGGEKKEKRDEKEKKKNRRNLPVLQYVLASGRPTSLCLRKDMLPQAQASRTWLLYLVSTHSLP